MVASSPPIESALPAFLEFAQGSVLVAHNAPFDVGFLKHFAAAAGSTLARLRGARHRPARPAGGHPGRRTQLQAQLAGHRVRLRHHAQPPGPVRRPGDGRRAARPDGAARRPRACTRSRSCRPSARASAPPYAASGTSPSTCRTPPASTSSATSSERVLYVGTCRDLRTRVRSYFTASETRSRMGEMVNLAASVTGIECATPLEAGVRELRLIAAHKPRYNRRSRHPEKMHWLKLTVEPWPRLSLVRKVAEDGADYLGPFASRRTAEKCLAALHETFPIRQCSDRLADHAARGRRACSPRWAAASRPCDGSVVGRPLRRPGRRGPRQPAPPGRRGRRGAHRPDGAGWPSDERFEEAGVHRDRLSAFVRAASRTQRLGSLSSCAELVAARREDDRRWAVHVVRHGRLAAVGRDPARRPRRGLGHRSCASPPRRSPPGPGRHRPRAPRSPSRSCAGSSNPASGSCTSRASGPAPSAAPPGTSRSTTRSSSPRTSLVPFDERRALATVHQP